MAASTLTTSFTSRNHGSTEQAQRHLAVYDRTTTHCAGRTRQSRCHASYRRLSRGSAVWCNRHKLEESWTRECVREPGREARWQQASKRWCPSCVSGILRENMSIGQRELIDWYRYSVLLRRIMQLASFHSMALLETRPGSILERRLQSLAHWRRAAMTRSRLTSVSARIACPRSFNRRGRLASHSCTV